VPAYANDDVPAPVEELAIDPVTGEPIEATDAPVSPTDPSANPDASSPSDDPADVADPLDLIDGGNDGSADDLGGLGGALGGATDARPLAVLLVALLILLLALPAAWRAVRRSLRLRSPDVLQRWREVRDTARDLGLPASETSTPRKLAESWGVGWSAADAAALDRLRGAFESRSYAAAASSSAPASSSSLLSASASASASSSASAGSEAQVLNAAETRQVLTALRRSTSWVRRVFAAAAPVSLADRTPHDERVWAEPL